MTELMRIETELQKSIEKTLTRDDIVKLTEIDNEVIAFIKSVRKSQEWESKRLNAKEVEVMFAVLANQHDVVMKRLRELIDQFNSRGEKD
jgi:hypothetical protein